MRARLPRRSAISDSALQRSVTASISNLKSAAVLVQSKEAALLLNSLASDPEFGLRSNLTLRAINYMYTRKDGTLKGNNVIHATEGTSIVEEPAAGVIVAALPV